MTVYMGNETQPALEIDYGDLWTRLGHILQPDRRCVVASSLDSVVSYLILSQALNWPMAGIYAPPALYLSAERAYPPTATIDAEKTLEGQNPVFVGMNVCREGIHSIGKDLLAWGPDTPLPPGLSAKSALNPNLLRAVTRRNAAEGFPFGLSYFVLCCMKHLGKLSHSEWPASLAPMLIYLGRGMQKSLRNPHSTLQWSDWLHRDETLACRMPLASSFEGLNTFSMIQAGAGFNRDLQAFGVSPWNQSLSIRGPFGWSRLYDLFRWLEETTGMKGRFGGFFKRPRLIFAVDSRSSSASLRGYRVMSRSRPFTYRIVGSGSRGLKYDRFAAETPANSAPPALTE